MSYVTDEACSRSADEVNAELAEFSREQVLRMISSLEEEMAAASASMDFEEAARLRDQVVRLRAQVEGESEAEALEKLKKSARKGSAFGKRKRLR